MEKVNGGEDFPPELETTTTKTNTEGGGGNNNTVKKLARQLDFTAFSSSSTPTTPPPPTTTASTTTATAPVVILPKPPQQQQQQNQIPQRHPVIQPRPQTQTPVPVTHAKSSSSPGFVVPAPPPPPTRPTLSVKTESPSGRPRANAEVKDGTPKKLKQCNCKNSRCLKLYCECFASGVYCDGCNCTNCSNNVENEKFRQEAVEATLERNPNAFRPKIASSPHGPDVKEEKGDISMIVKHNKGCHCKKSGCLKKYCECFQANILCSENCKCLDCKNYDGSEERRALFHEEHSNQSNALYMQQVAANAAITGAIGSSGYGSSLYGSPPISKKRKLHENFFPTTAKDSPVHRLAQTSQANHLRPSSTFSTSSSSPGVRAVNPASTGSSKPTYRSLLADVLQPQQIKDLCRIMVVVANEVSKTRPTVKKTTIEKKAESQADESIAAPSSRQSMSVEAGSVEILADPSNGNLAEKTCTDDPRSDGSDLPNGRPMSPGTLALMCDEQDTMFMAAASPNGRLGNGGNTPLPSGYGPETTGLYAEQERRVLTAFRDSLQHLVQRGTIKETKLTTRSEPPGSQLVQPTSNGTLRPLHPASTTELSQSLSASNNNLSRKVGLPNENGKQDQR